MFNFAYLFFILLRIIYLIEISQCGVSENSVAMSGDFSNSTKKFHVIWFKEMKYQRMAFKLTLSLPKCCPIVYLSSGNTYGVIDKSEMSAQNGDYCFKNNWKQTLLFTGIKLFFLKSWTKLP